MFPLYNEAWWLISTVHTNLTGDLVCYLKLDCLPLCLYCAPLMLYFKPSHYLPLFCFCVLIKPVLERPGHRRLQSCVGTRARLGYARFDAQLQLILSLQCTLYVRPCLRKHAYAIYRGLGACHVPSHPVLMIWESEITGAMLGYAQGCRRLWVRKQDWTKMECRYFNDTYFAHLQEAVEPKRSPQPSRKGNRSRSPSPSTLGALSYVLYIPSCMCAHRHNGFTSCV